MAHWTDKRTSAHGDLKQALKVVDDILSFVKAGSGKPSKKERALFAAAISYGVWENYVEQLAIELVREMASKLDPEKVPDRIKKTLKKEQRMGACGNAGMASALGQKGRGEGGRR